MEWTCDVDGTFVGSGRRPADYLPSEAGNSNRNNIGKGIIARLRARTTGVGKYERVTDPAKDQGKGLPVAKVNPVGVDRTLREEGVRKFMSPMETSEETAAEWRELLEDVLMIVFRSAKPSSTTDATSVKSEDPCCEHIDHLASYQIRKMSEIVGAMEISTPILRQIYACAGRYISCVSVNVDKRKMRGRGRRPPPWGKNLTDLIDVVNAVNDDLRQTALKRACTIVGQNLVKMIPAAAAASVVSLTSASTELGQPTDSHKERKKLNSNLKLLIDEFLVVRGKETAGSMMLNWRFWRGRGDEARGVCAEYVYGPAALYADLRRIKQLVQRAKEAMTAHLEGASDDNDDVTAVAELLADCVSVQSDTTSLADSWKPFPSSVAASDWQTYRESVTRAIVQFLDSIEDRLHDVTAKSADRDADAACQLDGCLQDVLRDVDDMHQMLVTTLASIRDSQPVVGRRPRRRSGGGEGEQMCAVHEDVEKTETGDGDRLESTVTESPSASDRSETDESAGAYVVRSEATISSTDHHTLSTTISGDLSDAAASVIDSCFDDIRNTMMLLGDRLRRSGVISSSCDDDSSGREKEKESVPPQRRGDGEVGPGTTKERPCPEHWQSAERPVSCNDDTHSGNSSRLSAHADNTPGSRPTAHSQSCSDISTSTPSVVKVDGLVSGKAAGDDQPTESFTDVTSTGVTSTSVNDNRGRPGDSDGNQTGEEHPAANAVVAADVTPRSVSSEKSPSCVCLTCDDNDRSHATVDDSLANDISLPGTPPGSAPCSNQVSPPGSKPVSPPGSAPGSPPGSLPGSPPRSTQVTPPGSLPVSPPGSLPASTPRSTQVTPPGSLPVSPPGSLPASPPRSTQVSPPGSLPVSPPGSLPGSLPRSTQVSPPGSPPVSPPGSLPGSPPRSIQVSQPDSPPGSPPGSLPCSTAGSPQRSLPGSPPCSLPESPPRSLPDSPRWSLPCSPRWSLPGSTPHSPLPCAAPSPPPSEVARQSPVNKRDHVGVGLYTRPSGPSIGIVTELVYQFEKIGHEDGVVAKGSERVMSLPDLMPRTESLKAVRPMDVDDNKVQVAVTRERSVSTGLLSGVEFETRLLHNVESVRTNIDQIKSIISMIELDLHNCASYSGVDVIDNTTSDVELANDHDQQLPEVSTKSGSRVRETDARDQPKEGASRDADGGSGERGSARVHELGQRWHVTTRSDSMLKPPCAAGELRPPRSDAGVVRSELQPGAPANMLPLNAALSLNEKAVDEVNNVTDLGKSSEAHQENRSDALQETGSEELQKKDSQEILKKDSEAVQENRSKELQKKGSKELQKMDSEKLQKKSSERIQKKGSKKHQKKGSEEFQKKDSEAFPVKVEEKSDAAFKGEVGEAKIDPAPPSIPSWPAPQMFSPHQVDIVVASVVRMDQFPSVDVRCQLDVKETATFGLSQGEPMQPGDGTALTPKVAPCKNNIALKTNDLVMVVSDEKVAPKTEAGDNGITSYDNGVTSHAGDNEVTSHAGDNEVTSHAGDNEVTSRAGDNWVTPPASDNGATSPDAAVRRSARRAPKPRYGSASRCMQRILGSAFDVCATTPLPERSYLEQDFEATFSSFWPTSVSGAPSPSNDIGQTEFTTTAVTTARATGSTEMSVSSSTHSRKSVRFNAATVESAGSIGDGDAAGMSLSDGEADVDTGLGPTADDGGVPVQAAVSPSGRQTGDVTPPESVINRQTSDLITDVNTTQSEATANLLKMISPPKSQANDISESASSKHRSKHRETGAADPAKQETTTGKTPSSASTPGRRSVSPNTDPTSQEGVTPFQAQTTGSRVSPTELPPTKSLSPSNQRLSGCSQESRETAEEVSPSSTQPRSTGPATETTRRVSSVSSQGSVAEEDTKHVRSGVKATRNRSKDVVLKKSASESSGRSSDADTAAQHRDNSHLRRNQSAHSSGSNGIGPTSSPSRNRSRDIAPVKTSATTAVKVPSSRRASSQTANVDRQPDATGDRSDNDGSTSCSSDCEDGPEVKRHSTPAQSGGVRPLQGVPGGSLLELPAVPSDEKLRPAISMQENSSVGDWFGATLRERRTAIWRRVLRKDSKRKKTSAK